MSSQETSETPRGYDLFANMPFLKLFTAFRGAIQPGRMMLAIACVAVMFIAGYVLDAIWPDSENVLTNPDSPYANEIYAAVVGDDVDAYHSRATGVYEQPLMRVLTGDPFKESEEKAQDLIATKSAYKTIKKEYRDQLSDAADDLKSRYDIRKKDIKEDFEKKIDEYRKEKETYELKRNNALAVLDSAYKNLTNALVTGRASAADVSDWIDEVVVVNPTLTGDARNEAREKINTTKKNITEALQLAQSMQLANQAQGTGIFKAFYQFKINCFHKGVQNLLAFNLPGTCAAMMDFFRGMAWLVKEHLFFSVILFAVNLVIIAVFGGAICRMAALQFARDERIGPMHALKFSFRKLNSFITAPLVPLGIIVIIGVLLALGGLIGGFIPIVGEILSGLLIPLALFGGFVIALVAIGLVGGFNLMYPAIAVEGSDSFDAISRSFSYLFSRPWRLGFYSVVVWIYGAICYLVVRLFIFVTLLAVHTAAGMTMNWGDSSLISARGQLNAIWPKPEYWNLVGDIPWSTLGWSETFSAVLIFIWVALAAGAALAFLVSFFYTAHTTIYFLLRRHVDATDLEDVYIEEPMENLLDEAQPAPDSPATPSDIPAAANPASQPSSNSNGQDSPFDGDSGTDKI